MKPIKEASKKMEQLAQTYTGRLLTGPEFEIKRMKGKHQEWLTKGKGGGAGTRTDDPNKKSIEDIVADCLVRVGTCRNITKDMVRRMPSADFSRVLLSLRFFTCDLYFVQREAERRDYEERKAAGLLTEKEQTDGIQSTLPPHEFKFKYDYKESGGDVKKTVDLSVKIGMDDFDVKPYGFTLTDAEYEDIMNGNAAKLTREMVLPITGKRLRWNLLTVDREYSYRHLLKDAELSSHTSLKMRNPCEMVAGEKEAVPLNFNLDDAEYLDLEAIREEATREEGNVETSIIVPHPETKADMPVNILNVVTFFFPSGVL